MIHENRTEILKETMSKAYWHKKWVETYIDDSRLLYDLAFDRIKKNVWSFERNSILDAGCGNGINTIRLVKRNFKVTSVDFSEEALNLCESNLFENNIRENVTIEKGDLLNLNFEENTFNSVLCWGVLMHIQEIEKALHELCRVLKPGGYLIICEVSKNAIDTVVGRVIKKVFYKNNYIENKNKFGFDTWSETEVGNILVRKTEISTLINYLSDKNFKLIDHFPGQFTQSYTKLAKGRLKNIVLSFNQFWYKHIRFVSPSLEHILVFKKNDIN